MANLAGLATSVRTIGIIGTGGLGEHVIKMLLRRPKTLMDSVNILGSVRNPIREKDLLHRFGPSIKLEADNRKIAVQADILILSVKPGQVKDICREIHTCLSPKTPVISMAAAVPLEKLCAWLPKMETVIRCMPNIPCSAGTGMVPYHSESKDALGIVTDIFAPNKVLALSGSREMDASTLISGCGPAFISWYVECLKKVGEGIIEAEKLNQLIIQTMLGTATMLQNYTPIQIMRAVASPKGATEAALSSLNIQEIDVKIHAALIAARDRIRTIADSM
jgi:pyrroline-5-carboxylate reductase